MNLLHLQIPTVLLDRERDREREGERAGGYVLMARLSSSALLPAESFDLGVSADVAGPLRVVWEQIKAPVIVPLLRLMVLLCLLMSVMLFVEKVYMAIVILLIKLFGKKPTKLYRWEAIRDIDIEMASSHINYPMVLVQIPMFNEKEVVIVIYKHRSISFSKLIFLLN